MLLTDCRNKTVLYTNWSLVPPNDTRAFVQKLILLPWLQVANSCGIISFWSCSLYFEMCGGMVSNCIILQLYINEEYTSHSLWYINYYIIPLYFPSFSKQTNVWTDLQPNSEWEYYLFLRIILEVMRGRFLLGLMQFPWQCHNCHCSV